MPESSTLSSSGFSRIEVAIRPSPGLALVASIPWLLLPALAMNLDGLPAIIILTVALAATTGLVTTIRHQLLLGRHSPNQLRITPDGLRVRLRDGQEQPARISGESRITHRLLWLRLRCEGQSHTLLLSDLPGFRNTDPHSLRRLTGWLRLGPAHAGDA
ncbi:MAG: hypothetical protein ACQERE_04395 [Pseudomonadota bacterium]